MRSFSVAYLVIILAVCISCLGVTTPTSPSTQPELSAGTTASGAARTCWGVWDVSINPDDGSVDITPLRGASFQANVVNFLQPPSAPIHLLRIDIDPNETNFPAGKVTCDVTIQHPFPGTKFCGFDVLGIIMGDHDGFAFESDPDIITSFSPNTLLQNPDGWTRWWNQVEFTTYGTLFGYIEGAQANHNWTSTHTLNAFKYFCDELDPYDAFNPSPEGRGFFSSVDPGFNKRHYELQFPIDVTLVFHFKYAVSASWVSPYESTKPPYTADDFPPEANMPEAYRIGFLDMGSTAYYVDESSYGGDLNLFIDVWDWQFDGDPGSISEQIQSVRIESPTLFPSPVELDLSEAIVNPSNPTSVRIRAFVGDVTPTGLENQLLLVTVESAEISTYEPQIPGISGFEYPDGHLAAYSIVQVPIKSEAPPNLPPVADASASRPKLGCAPSSVRLDPSLSYDPDGWIILYEWDFDADGVYDASTTPPDVVEREFAKGIHNVVLRVTDNAGKTDTDEVLIEARECESNWPMPNADPARTSRTDAVGPSTNHVAFTWEAPECFPIFSDVAVDHLGRAIVRPWASGAFYCIDTDGVPSMVYDAGDFVIDSPVVAPDGTYYTSIGYGNSIGSHLLHIDIGGDLVWSTELGMRSVIVQDDGSIICARAQTLYKLDPYGQEIWSYPTGNGGIGRQVAVGTDGTIYCCGSHGDVRAIDQEGDLVWQTDCTDDSLFAGPALGPYGIYAATGIYGGGAYCLDYDGNIVWNDPDITSHYPFAIGHDGEVYVAGQYKWDLSNRRGRLLCLDPLTGEIEWQFSRYDEFFSCTPIVDGAGRIYFSNLEGKVYCLTDNGDLLWEYDAGGKIQCRAPALANDGTLYFTCGHNPNNHIGRLIAFRDE